MLLTVRSKSTTRRQLDMGKNLTHARKDKTRLTSALRRRRLVVWSLIRESARSHAGRKGRKFLQETEHPSRLSRGEIAAARPYLGAWEAVHEQVARSQKAPAGMGVRLVELSVSGLRLSRLDC